MRTGSKKYEQIIYRNSRIFFILKSGGYGNLHLAALAGDAEAVLALMKVEDPNGKTELGRTPILVAAGAIGKQAVFRFEIITISLSSFYTEHGRPNVVEEMLAADPSLASATTSEGGTLAHLAAASGVEDTLVALEDHLKADEFKEVGGEIDDVFVNCKDAPIVIFLQMINSRDIEGKTPLMEAVRRQKEPMAKYLLGSLDTAKL